MQEGVTVLETPTVNQPARLKPKLKIMERNTIPAKKQYDISAMGEFFRDIIAPEELRKELVELAFDYAQYIDEGSTDLFKNNMSTIYILYRALEGVKELETQG